MQKNSKFFWLGGFMADKKIVPAPGYILVEPLEVERTTASGIVLPDSVEEKPLKGRVLSVGPSAISEKGAEVKPWDKVKPNAVIVYKKWAGNEYKPDGNEKELLFVKFEDILAVIA